ncbi:wd-repeat protein : WD repeat protein OS=Streptomyces sviceus ATCC 29083 GN=SSEG_01371 PE=4 SV=2: WD40: WD40 [Gemmataceae bacterium]|nr:wd-repeat protein : WD repeat protein OS=Streptomyces sviceus ATCC 29083 GN=SSEG_01371 PE=4 SV=2: WD40: WD40 [Gemmataceae bacterium]VTT98003.1 wd-repeat protein : WD repeat protein OS=Streptomyces sviceus ATCC 29083 GN=SSEG_01371 PE=4 SV=2: WD40: WD40 [Gemmataceae bacterium]
MIVLAHRTQPVGQVAFAPIGSLLAVGYDFRWVSVWDCATQRLLGEVESVTGFRPGWMAFVFAPSQQVILYPDDMGDGCEVFEFDPISQNIDSLGRNYGIGWVEGLLMTRDEKHLLVHDSSSSQFHLFDLTRKSKSPVWSVPVYSEATRGIWVCMEFLPGEERFFVTENHGNTRTRVSVRALETGELVAAARFPQRETLGLAVSPNGERAVVVSEMSLFVYDPSNLKAAPRKVKNDNRKHFTAVAFHPSNRYLAATSNDQTVKLYDTTTWTVAKTYTWDVGRMRSVAFSPDGTLAAAGSDTGKVVVWDVDV